MEGELFRASIVMLHIPSGTAFVNDFSYADKSSGSTHIDTNVAAGDFQTLVQAKFQAALPESMNFVKYRFACVAGGHAGEVGEVVLTDTQNGELTGGTTLPNEVCISLKRSTGYATRRDRGRIFFGPVHSDLYGASRNSPDLESGQLQDVMNLLKTNLVTQTRTLKPIILSSTNTTNGHDIVRASIGHLYTHRKSRRPRLLV